MSPFCDPVTVTSTPHSSWWKSMDASEDTVSTMKSAGWPVASMAARMSGRLVVTPVEVSLCTIMTARMRPGRSRRSLSSTSWGSTPARQSPDTRSTSSPRRSATSAHFPAKKPRSKARTRSPGASVFTSAASHAPVAEEGKTKTVPSVLKTGFRSSSTARVSSANSGPRWSMTARSMARRTRSGTLVGPGSWRKCRPLRVVMRPSGDVERAAD